MLAIEVRNRKDELIARHDVFFQRNNPVTYDYDLQAMDKLDLEGKFSGAFSNVDSLAEHIASLSPIADPLEAQDHQRSVQGPGPGYDEAFLLQLLGQPERGARAGMGRIRDPP